MYFVCDAVIEEALHVPPDQVHRSAPANLASIGLPECTEHRASCVQGIRGCLNVFGMAVNLLEQLHRGRISGEGPDGYPWRIDGVPILLDIWPQNSYAGFCFIKARAEQRQCVRDGA